MLGLICISYLHFAAGGMLNFDQATSQGGNVASFSAPYVEVGLCGVAMMLGILFGTVHERLKDSMASINLVAEFGAALRSAPFLRAMLVSPLVFVGVYMVVRTQPDLVIAVVFAFQNGFFCEAVFRKKAEAVGGT